MNKIKQLWRWIMSLYIGKDSTLGRNKLVISKTSLSEDAMANSNTIDNNIVFNSVLPLATVEYISVVSPSYYETTNAFVYYIPFSPSDWAIVSTRSLIVKLNDVYIDCKSKPYESYDSIGDYGAYAGINTYELDFTNNRVLVFVPKVAQSNMSIIVLPFNLDGTIPTQSDLTGEVIIGNGEVLFNGIDILRRKFLVIGTVNSTDVSFTYRGILFQIVNSVVPVSSDLELSSTTSETKITYGGKTVLTSTGTYVPLLETSDYSTVTISNYYITSPITGFTLSASSLYYMSLRYTYQTTNGPVSSTFAFLAKADSIWYNDTLFSVPADSYGSCLGVNKKRVNLTSIDIQYQIVTCQGGGQPTDSWSNGPYDVTLRYKKLVDIV